MAEEKLPYWIEAPEEVRTEFPKLLDKARLEYEGKGEPADWAAINVEMIQWWKEKGYRFP